MKSRTHSGAKKRLKLLPGGKVKRKHTRKRHLLSSKNAKQKHNLSSTAYVAPANMNQTRRILNF
jgi:large subunit ribosomal protein L35